MPNSITVTLNGKKVECQKGATVASLLSKSPHNGKSPAVAAMVNNHLTGLYRQVRDGAVVTTLDISYREGMEVYRRTACMILYAAILDIDPKLRVEIGQSIGNGYFMDVVGHKVTREFARDLEARMRKIVGEDIYLKPEWVPIEEAIAHFESEGREDKVLLLRQMKRGDVKMLNLGKYRGYLHGPVAYCTGVIDKFALQPYKHGLVLLFPDTDGNFKAEVEESPKLFAVYMESRRWNELIRTGNVAQLNEHCIRGRIADVVRVAEALHEREIAAIADKILSHRDAKVILVAGPTASGKTTFAKRLAVHLRLNGIEPVSLSMDSYYLDKDVTPRNLNGSVNFEALEALDIKLFNKHLEMLLSGKEVPTPIYSFMAGRRLRTRTIPIKLQEHQILMTEGIHGLNDQLTQMVPARRKFKVYVSALTQLCIDDHNRIFTSDTRLMRRVVRDRMFRNATAEETILNWPSVRRGENKYIFPFQENADVMFNSALAYEHSLIKPYAERFLMEVPRESPAFVEASRLFRFLDLLIPILPEEVPHNSILREFVGGSTFRY